MGPHAFATSCLHATPYSVLQGVPTLEHGAGASRLSPPPISCSVAFKRWGQGNLRLSFHGAATLWWLNKVAFAFNGCDVVIKPVIRSFLPTAYLLS